MAHSLEPPAIVEFSIDNNFEFSIDVILPHSYIVDRLIIYRSYREKKIEKNNKIEMCKNKSY